jgi:hypothetical protein
MGEFGTVRRRVQKLQAALFSHFLCIFYHQGNPSLAEKKGEKDSYPVFGHNKRTTILLLLTRL